MDNHAIILNIFESSLSRQSIEKVTYFVVIAGVLNLFQLLTTL